MPRAARKASIRKKTIQVRFLRVGAGLPFAVLMTGRFSVGQVGTSDDDDAPLRDLEAALAVLLRIKADRRVGGDFDVLVDDGAADAAMAADVHAVEQDRRIDLGVAVDADVGRQDALADVAAADDA